MTAWPISEASAPPGVTPQGLTVDGQPCPAVQRATAMHQTGYRCSRGHRADMEGGTQSEQGAQGHRADTEHSDTERTGAQGHRAQGYRADRECGDMEHRDTEWTGAQGHGVDRSTATWSRQEHGNTEWTGAQQHGVDRSMGCRVRTTTPRALTLLPLTAFPTGKVHLLFASPPLTSTQADPLLPESTGLRGTGKRSGGYLNNLR